MKVLCIGQITYDYTMPIDGFPIEGLKYDIVEKTENSSGGACNSAYLLAKWKEDVVLSAAVGGDELGTKIRRDLDDIGINSGHIEVVFESKTPISFVLVNKNTGNMTTFAINSNAPHLKKYEYDFSPEVILMDGYEYAASIAVCNRFPNAVSILDASENTKEISELCKYAKYIIASQKFAESFAGAQMDFNNPTTLLDVYKKVALKYPNSNLIITLGQHGAIYLDDNQIKVMPGLKVEEVVDANGAGDIFRAAFAAGISRGYEMEKIMRISNIAAGLSIKKNGIKDSMPLFSDVVKYYEDKFGSIELPIKANVEQGQVPEQRTPVTQQVTQDSSVTAPQAVQQPAVQQQVPVEPQVQAQPAPVNVNNDVSAQ